MDYKELVCKCKQVTYEQIDNVVKNEKDISDVVKVFEDVQRETHCSTGCGGGACRSAGSVCAVTPGPLPGRTCACRS